MNVLVVIANYGTGHQQYLSRLIQEYRSMPYHIDITVLSDISKAVPPGVSLIVALPTKNPWSLPHGHKQIFARSLEHYDLFIYSEDDHLISERNIEAFLSVTQELPDDEIAGFLVSEQDKNGEFSFCAMHGSFHWDPTSVQRRGPYTFSFFTNEHSACYLLTRPQLRRAIESGGFLVEPHDGKYDLPCSAATDIYTQCGFRKMVCISHLQDFMVPHLPNKYVGKYGLGEQELNGHIRALLDIDKGARPAAILFNPETRLKGTPWSKDYYEPPRDDILSVLPSGVRSVLSVGCGWGKTEERLLKRGLRVVGVPVDSVIAASAEARGVEIVHGDFKTARNALAHARFDCILFCGVLHLLADPVGILASFAQLLSSKGIVVLSVPNHNYLGVWRARLRSDERLKGMGDYQETGLHMISRRVVRKWFKKSGLKPREIAGCVPSRFEHLHRSTFGVFGPLLQSEIIATATKV